MLLAISAQTYEDVFLFAFFLAIVIGAITAGGD